MVEWPPWEIRKDDVSGVSPLPKLETSGFQIFQFREHFQNLKISEISASIFLHSIFLLNKKSLLQAKRCPKGVR